MGEVLALLAGFFFSSSNLMCRRGMKNMNRYSGHVVTLLVTNIMNAVALLILFALARFPQINVWGLFYFSLAGVFTTFAGRFFLFASIERIGASRAGLFKVSAPVFTIFLGISILGDRLTPRDLAGTAVVLCGLYLLSVSGDFSKPSIPPVGIVPYAQQKEQPFRLDAGVVFGLLSGLFLSCGHIFRKLGLMHIESPFVGVATGTFVSLLCISTYLLITTGDWDKLAGLAGQTISFKPQCRGFFWGGFFNTFAQYLFFFSLMYTSVSLANILISTEALFNLLLVAIFFRDDEPLTPRLVANSMTVLVGVILILV